MWRWLKRLAFGGGEDEAVHVDPRPDAVDATTPRPRGTRTGHVERRTWSGDAGDLSDLPPEVRPKVQAALRDGAGSSTGEGTTRVTRTVRHRITVRDADGVERTYTDPGELPPEHRAMLEQARRAADR